MPSAYDVHGRVFKNASATLLARVVGAGGMPVTRASLQAGSYTVVQLDDSDPDSEAGVAGHVNQAVNLDQVIFDNLERDPLWTVDDLGYNFRHVLDVGTNQAFPTAGLFYRVRYHLTPTSGQPIVVRFLLKAI